jgi:hypothetical protein
MRGTSTARGWARGEMMANGWGKLRPLPAFVVDFVVGANAFASLARTVFRLEDLEKQY